MIELEESRSVQNSNAGNAPGPVRYCRRCVLDSSDIRNFNLDENGYCNYCNAFFTTRAKFETDPAARQIRLENLINQIKLRGAGRKYDCVLGLSGGVDSSYLAYWAWKAGLRPIAVHFDNGWNSELAVHNINGIIEKTGFDLFTYVVNWDEFRDLQRAYFKAGVIDIEVPTDHMIFATLYRVAAENNIGYLLSGTNYQTEGILPLEWAYDKNDLVNLIDIHRRFGELKLRSYPKLGYLQRFVYDTVRKIKFVEPLPLQEYNKHIAKQTIMSVFGWRDYGGKHYESVFTKFYQGYVLPTKFGVDKRKAHLSTLICNGEMSRAEAIAELERAPIDREELRQLYDYCIKKLGFSPEEFDQLMQQPPVPHQYYRHEGRPGLKDRIAMALVWRLGKFFRR